MEGYDKPTLFVHGDTHIFHVSKPLVSKKTRRFVDNFTRVEVFGDPDSHWVRISVDPAKPGLFTVEPEIIPETSQIAPTVGFSRCRLADWSWHPEMSAIGTKRTSQPNRSMSAFGGKAPKSLQRLTSHTILTDVP